MYRIVYHATVRQDLKEAFYYISNTLCAPQAAEDLLDSFDAAIQRIAEFPHSFELYRADYPIYEEIRKVRVKNYVLYYAVFDDYVEIRRFIHGRRDRSKIM